MANSTQITVLNSASVTATVSTLDGFIPGVGTALLSVTNATASGFLATVSNATAANLQATVTGTTVISGSVTVANSTAANLLALVSNATASLLNVTTTGIVTLSGNSSGIITTGVAGSASTQVLTMQGIAGMTGVNVVNSTGSLLLSQVSNATASLLNATITGTAAISGSLPAGTAVIGAVNGNTTSVSVVLAITTTTVYGVGQCVGGKTTFTSILPGSFSGILQSVQLLSKGVAYTTEFDIAIFPQNPTNSTFTDHATVTWNAADGAFLAGGGIYNLTVANSQLGAMASYNLDGIGKALIGTTQNLWGVITTKNAVTPTTTGDITVVLSVLQG